MEVLIDFDEILDWTQGLGSALAHCLPKSFAAAIRNADPKYMEDARDVLLRTASRDAVVDGVLNWLSANSVIGYHGTRLTSDDISVIKTAGLIPLLGEARRTRIVRALSKHPLWDKIKGRLDEVLYRIGPACAAGRREGQVHLTLSRGGLTSWFNHYLLYGSEFDYHAAHELLGEDWLNLLKNDGEAALIQVAVPGAIAIKAAHPYFSVNEMRDRGEMPNIVGEFIAAWAFYIKG